MPEASELQGSLLLELEDQAKEERLASMQEEQELLLLLLRRRPPLEEEEGLPQLPPCGRGGAGGAPSWVLPAVRCGSRSLRRRCRRLASTRCTRRP